MALPKFLIAFSLALAVANIELVTCDVVKGSVSCVDCSRDYDLSGIRVLIKCDKVKKLATATTQKNGAFEAKLPLTEAQTSAAAASPKCLAKLLGGPNQLYASKKTMVSRIVRDQELNAYTVSTPLTFAGSCSSATSGEAGQCGNLNTEFGSSKFIDLPVPPEYGLPPANLYVPFLPIIGIP